MDRNLPSTLQVSPEVDASSEVAEPLLREQSDPPPFILSIADEASMQSLSSGAGPPKFDEMEPPAYDVAIKLPTYEEAQQEKIAEQQQYFNRPIDGRIPSNDPRNFNILASFAPVGDSQFDPNTAELALGTDVYFFASFLIAFLFNWIGFLLLVCACHTVAGRYGALAGFGLSLAKWTLIVKHSTDLVSNDNNWLWWLIMAFGILICVRAVIQYLCVKREWHRLSRAAQERVVFFY